LGVIYHRKGDTEKGIAFWQDVVALPVTDTDALIQQEETELTAAANMNLGAHYALAKDLDTGLKYMEAAMTLDPDDGEIRYNMAATLAALGKMDEAIQQFEAAEERGIEIAREVINKLKAGMAKEGQDGKK
jgi:tetratricopeptide (TPR) repeat protein